MMATTIDISAGEELRIVGFPADIDRIQQACKKQLDRLAESPRVDLNEPMRITIPERDRT